MHKYVINDIWMSLKLSFNNFFWWVGLLVILFVFLIFHGDGNGVNQTSTSNFFVNNIDYFLYFCIVSIPLAFIQSVLIYLANRRYIIDLETGHITFPRSDVENSLLAIIVLAPYWNRMRTKTIHASEVENIYIDSKKWSTKSKMPYGFTAKGKPKYKTIQNIRYNVNIVGTFGSANLVFQERQKRDEVRNAIQQCVKKISGKNIDRKVSEFN